MEVKRILSDRIRVETDRFLIHLNRGDMEIKAKEGVDLDEREEHYELFDERIYDLIDAVRD